MTAPTSSITTKEKLEKLTRVSLYKNWDAQLYAKLVGQLKDSCHDLDSNTAAESIFGTSTKEAKPKGQALNLMVLDYVTTLALDPNSVLPMHELVLYCRSTSTLSPQMKSTIIIYLGQKLKALPQSLIKKTIAAFVDYMESSTNSAHESRAIANWLIKLANHQSFYEVYHQIENFKPALLKFCASTSLDTHTSRELQLCYDMGESEKTTKLTRAYRLLWLDRAMKCSGRIQKSSFMVELTPFLNTQSKETVARELVITAFDCYANALLVKNPKYLSLWKGFIVKILPDIIKDLATQNGTSNSLEAWVCQPLQQLDRGTVNLLRISGGGDALDEMFSSFPSTTSDIRHEFLLACVAFDLIDIEAVRRALGQEAASMAEEAHKGKAGSDFILDSNGVELPIDEIFYRATQENAEYVSFEESTILRIVNVFEEVDGVRQHKISQKLLQNISDWIASHNARGLRRLCQALCTRIGALDALMLHIQPIQLLLPLVRYLDNWKLHPKQQGDNGNDEDEDEDDVNFQEEYTDFGCILLLIVLMFNRYEMAISDLRDEGNGFVAGIIDPSYDSTMVICMDDLSSDQKDLLGEWIVALFDSGGIGDDLMKSSSIKDLMTLAPLIFQQTISARSKNIIDNETLKGGLEYFLQAFLLGTLVTAFKYLCFNLWGGVDPMVTLQVIHCLTVPSGMSGDAVSMHTAVMNVISTRLELALSQMPNPPQNSVELGQISNAIAPFAINVKQQEQQQQHQQQQQQQQVDGNQKNSMQLNQVKDQTQNQTGGGPGTTATNTNVILMVKEQTVVLSNWAQACDQNMVMGPPDFKPHAITQAIDTIGATTVLKVLLDEIDLAEAQSSLKYTLDVVSSLVVVLDTIHKDQRNFQPTRRRLDSSLLAVIQDFSEENIVVLRGKTGASDETALSGFKKLRKRVESMMKQCEAVRITPETNSGVEPPSLPPPVDSAFRPSYPSGNHGNNNDGGNDFSNNNDGGNNQDNNDSMFDPSGGTMDDPLMGLDVTMPDDGLFGDEMMMDLS